MKVAICSHDYPNYTSGPNVWLDRIISEFQSSGIEPVVLFTRGGIGKEYRYVTSIKEKGIPVYVYDGKKYTEHIIEWIIAVLNQEMPDIFIPNYDPAGLYAARWVREAGIPTIGALRSDHKEYMAFLELFVRKNDEFRLSAMVCVSKYLESIALQGNHRTIIRRIPSGTPIPEEKAKNNSEQLRLIYAGKISEKAKRISEVTQVLCETVKQVPGTEAVLYGSGNAIDTVTEIIKNHGPGLPVRYGGVLDHDELQKQMLNSQVFVLLSDYEGLPTSLMEAMACGLVPICTNIDSGIPELVEHEKTGFLVNDRGVEFIDAVRRLKSENDLWEKLSGKARSKVEKEYSTQNSANKWVSLIRELMLNNEMEKRVIEIPGRLKLPKLHPDLSRSEHRWNGYVSYYSRKAGRKLYGFASRGKHKILNLLTK